MKQRVFLFTLFLSTATLFAQKHLSIIEHIDQRIDSYEKVAMQIFDWAEMGYQEVQSSALLKKTLEEAGFSITSAVADIPTAFIAEFGTVGPIIGILGEFDALPGISQKAVPYKESANSLGGHACGHHLFGTASAAAAIAVKAWLEETGTQGIIRFYGTPAEEGGGAKVYMAREGLFDDVDVVLHWHPGASNQVNEAAALANISAKFRFKGVSAHAAAAPERGRSALDAVESMNYMVNLMREHIPQETRIHYVITDGGKAPNVIPDFAEVYYYSRHPRRDEVKSIFDRIVKAGEGAALGTETTMSYEIVNGVHELLPNETLERFVHKSMSEIGGYTYNEQERAFAKEISNSMGLALNDEITQSILPYQKSEAAFGSTDAGDVSFVAPTVGFRTATWVPGTPAHSWQAVAAGGTSIGVKGMALAAKTLAVSAAKLYKSPKVIAKAKEEFEQRRGKDFTYVPLLGNRPPALDYRN
ncbi:MAG: amidohydrolase [Bacteroidetes bacterium]|nr:amidohydrolase [Bacteroidota bacterium]